jgi:hypothetical protein
LEIINDRENLLFPFCFLITFVLFLFLAGDHSRLAHAKYAVYH